jgi:hypothetical protein
MVNRSEAIAKWIRSIHPELLIALSFRLDLVFWLLGVLFIQIHSDWPSFLSSDIVKIKVKIFYSVFDLKLVVFSYILLIRIWIPMRVLLHKRIGTQFRSGGQHLLVPR